MGVLATASLLAFIVHNTNGYRIDYYNEGPNRQNQWFMVHEDNSAHSANHAYTKYPVSDKQQFQNNNANPAHFDNIFNKFQKILLENGHINFNNPHTRPQKETYKQDGLFSRGSRASKDSEFYDSENKYEEGYNGNVFSKGNGRNEEGLKQNVKGYDKNIFLKGIEGAYKQHIFSKQQEGESNNQNKGGYNRNEGFYNQKQIDNGNKVVGKGYEDSYNQYDDESNRNILSTGNTPIFNQYHAGSVKIEKHSERNEGVYRGDRYSRNIFSKGFEGDHNQNEEGYIGNVFSEGNIGTLKQFAFNRNKGQNNKNIFSYNKYNKNKFPAATYKTSPTIQNQGYTFNTFSTPVKPYNHAEDFKLDQEDGNENQSYELDDSTESKGMSYKDELRYNEQAEKAVESLYKKNTSDYEDSSNLPSNYIPVVSEFNKEDDDAAEVHYHRHKHMHNHKHTQEHKHEHEQDHIHAHVAQNQHVHKHQQEHQHEHDNKHEHQHKHLQQHKHEHVGEHKHDHAHKHAHLQEHKHAHQEDHKHAHDHHHGHEHKHDHHGEDKHDHHHGHKHSHLGEHKHDHHHGHKHGHKHGNKHGHKHDHKHGHGNKHRHNHGHIHKKLH